MPDSPEFQTLLSRAMTLCSAREYAPSDLRTKLSAWGASPDLIDDVLERLTTEDYLSAERYARAFTHDKILFARWGRRKVAYHLAHKGIPSSVVSAALDAFDDDQYTALVREELSKKARHFSRPFSPSDRARLFRFAQSRGYESSFLRDFFDADD